MDLSNRTNTTKITPRSSDNEFDGSNFSNNLFSDLAPLLTLFGEQVTKQFLSQAMGYADDILLAMAPLGILTCVVSAIRVGGRKWLKALVGRARESRATAEMEIMSSTSDAVCELWSGAEIVRERGSPQTKEFIYQPVSRDTGLTDLLNSKIVYDLKTACEESILKVSPRTPAFSPQLQYHKLDPREQLAHVVECATSLMQQAPNLTLNVTDAITSPGATWAFAALGVVIQLGVIVIASLVTYHWHLTESGFSRVQYGFPLFLTGSSLLCAGIFLCSYIIESTTQEINFELVEGKPNTKVVRVQCACTVGDQRFGSYAIMNEDENTTIRTSRIKDGGDFSLLSIIAMCLSLGGYILQFVGLRAMHWSVAITVLGATVIMACVRAYVRRGLAANPQVVKLHEGHELSWVALDALGLSSFGLERSSQRCATETDPESTAMALPLARKVVEVRKEMRHLVPWPDEYITLARQLAHAITRTLQYVMADLKYFDFEEEELAASLVAFERSTGDKFLSKVFTLEEYSEKREEMAKLNGSRKKGKHSLRLNLRRPGRPRRGRHRRVQRSGARRAIGRTWFGTRKLTSAKRSTTPRRHPVEADAKPLERGNWFWENRDLIEDAASENDLKTPPGFSFYIYQQSDEVFGASFAWESEAILSGASVGDLRTAAKYRFLARCIFQNDQQDDEDAESENRFRPRSNQGDSEKHVWTTDVGSLAALLSLWMHTMETKVGRTSHHHASTRLLGCGWQVPVPDVAFKRDPKNKEIFQWIPSVHSGGSAADDDKGLGVEGDHSGESEEGMTDYHSESGDTEKKTESDSPEPEVDSNIGECGIDEDEGLGVQDHSVRSKDLTSGYVHPYKRADFYSVWIERKTPALTVPSFHSYLQKPQVPGCNILPLQSHIFGTFFSSHSRFGPTSLDQQAYGNMCSNHRKLRLEALQASNTQQGNAETSRAAARKSKLVSHMWGEDERAVEDGDSPVSLYEDKAVKTHTPLPRLCAQEIFSAFMLQLVATMSEVKGEARRRTPLRGDHANTLRWHHGGLSRLAGIVRESKLATDEEEAYMLIVPAFHAHGLLPTRPPGDSELTYSASSSSSDYTFPSSYYYDTASISSGRRSRETARTRGSREV